MTDPYENVVAVANGLTGLLYGRRFWLVCLEFDVEQNVFVEPQLYRAMVWVRGPGGRVLITAKASRQDLALTRLRQKADVLFESD